MNRYLNSELQPMPYSFFSTAAGPDISDLAGPPGSVLDIYPSGEPMSAAEQDVAHGRGSGGPTSLLARADLHALILIVVGGFMIHRYARS